MHLIGVVDIPGIHSIQFVRIGFQNDPVLLSCSYRDARQGSGVLVHMGYYLQSKHPE